MPCKYTEDYNEYMKIYMREYMKKHYKKRVKVIKPKIPIEVKFYNPPLIVSFD